MKFRIKFNLRFFFLSVYLESSIRHVIRINSNYVFYIIVKYRSYRTYRPVQSIDPDKTPQNEF